MLSTVQMRKIYFQCQTYILNAYHLREQTHFLANFFCIFDAYKAFLIHLLCMLYAVWACPSLLEDCVLALSSAAAADVPSTADVTARAAIS